MPGVNGIPSAPSSYVRSQVISGGELERSKDSQNAGLAVDTYTGNSEAWHTRVTSSVGGNGCRCKDCPACAAQAYVLHGQPLNGEEKLNPVEPVAVQEQDEDAQEGKEAAASGSRGVDGEVLSRQDQARIAELKKNDRAVHAHEQAHLFAAGNLVRRGISLSYAKGPDGQRYAVAGEVSIDTSKEADPADTITKMRTIRAAALAPAEPSPQDRKVAAAAVFTMFNAMHELQLAKNAEEIGAKVVARAAEDTKGRKDGHFESGGGETARISLRRRIAIQRYTASGGVPGNKVG